MENKRLTRLLKTFNKLYGKDSVVFIPHNKESFEIIKENLEYSKKQLLDLKNSIKEIDAQIYFYQEVIKELKDKLSEEGRHGIPPQA